MISEANTTKVLTLQQERCLVGVLKVRRPVLVVRGFLKRRPRGHITVIVLNNETEFHVR